MAKGIWQKAEQRLLHGWDVIVLSFCLVVEVEDKYIFCRQVIAAEM